MCRMTSVRTIAVLLCALHFWSAKACGQWYGSADFLIPTRSAGTDLAFQYHEKTTSGGDTTVSSDPILTASDVRPDFTAAGRFTVGVRRGTFGVEGSYLLTKDWVTSANASDVDGMMASPFTLTGSTPNPLVDDNSFVSVTYQTELANMELNGLQEVAANEVSTLDVLFGLRYMKIGESLDYMTTNADGDDVRWTSTKNQMIGPQFGLAGHLMAPGGMFNLTLKGGYLFNSIDRSREVHNSAAEIDSFVADGSDQGSLLGELGVEYQFNATNWLSWRIGYQVIGVSDVGLANLNLIEGSDSGVQTSGVWYQLPYTGAVIYF